jgi:hypothetical protein
MYGLSSLMCCHVLDFGYPVLYLHLFKPSLLLTSGFLPCFLVGFLPFFMPERIGLRKLFAKLGCCMTLCSFLDHVVNCSQHS